MKIHWQNIIVIQIQFVFEKKCHKKRECVFVQFPFNMEIAKYNSSCTLSNPRFGCVPLHFRLNKIIRKCEWNGSQCIDQAAPRTTKIQNDQNAQKLGWQLQYQLKIFKSKELIPKMLLEYQQIKLY
ncbi:unnamed protein product [Paramecium pentaurelia]|uniref:Uncharacterized protein n=1 Tax=Paramecium pentaurelia TaxID=43138 RepID=A0A8S1VRX4_9CILI|nr:unnamed protein product [Paramecium pentaurelia]